MVARSARSRAFNRDGGLFVDIGALINLFGALHFTSQEQRSSGDEFGPAAESRSARALSWEDVLTQLQARAGDVLTVSVTGAGCDKCDCDSVTGVEVWRE
jgi:hypothetical protein